MAVGTFKQRQDGAMEAGVWRQPGPPLVPASNATGFKGVSHRSGSSRPFAAQIKQDGKDHSLGTFTSAAEAALAVARHLGPAGCAAALAMPAAPEPPMTEAEARRLAAAKGLSLVPAENATGWKGVSHDNRPGLSKPFQAAMKQGSERHSLGSFSSAAEAALAYARHLGPAGCAAATAPPAAPEQPMTEAEARRLAAEEGLELLPADNHTGFRGVSTKGNGSRMPYQAKIRKEGKQRSLGTFTSPFEAALAYARAGGR